MAIEVKSFNRDGKAYLLTKNTVPPDWSEAGDVKLTLSEVNRDGSTTPIRRKNYVKQPNGSVIVLKKPEGSSNFSSIVNLEEAGSGTSKKLVTIQRQIAGDTFTMKLQTSLDAKSKQFKIDKIHKFGTKEGLQMKDQEKFWKVLGNLDPFAKKYARKVGEFLIKIR